MSLLHTTRSSRSRLVVSLNGMICFLFVSVMVIPYRYLVLSEWPPLVGALVQHWPEMMCVVIGVLWLILQKREFWPFGYMVPSEDQQISDGHYSPPSIVHRLSSPLCFTVILMFVAGLLSSLGAERVGLSLVKEVYYFFTGSMLFFIVADFYAHEKSVLLPLFLILFTGYGIALYGIVEFALGKSPIYEAIFSIQNERYLQLSPDPWFGKRILSSIGHPVFLGTFLSVLLPLSLSFVFQEQSWIKRISFGGGTLLIFVALILTFSRGAWLAGVVGGLVFWKLQGVRFVRYITGILFVLCVSVVLLLSFKGSSDIFQDRMKEAYELYILNFSATSRGKAFGHTMEIVAMSPLLGVGTGMYRFKAYQLGKDVLWPPTLDTPDNMYFLKFAEHGVLGLCMMVLFIGYFFKSLFNALNKKTPKNSQILLIGFISSFVAFFLNMLTCSAWNFPATRFLFWILSGIAVATMALLRGNRQER